MTSPEAGFVDEEIKSLSRRIAQLEAQDAQRRKSAKLVTKVAGFLGFLTTVLYVGVFITSIMLTNVSGHLNALLQSIMFTSCLASFTFVLISLLGKSETAPQELPAVVKAETAA